MFGFLATGQRHALRMGEKYFYAIREEL